MQREFVTYEIALGLKKLGFDEECLYAYYHKSDLKNFKENHYVLVGDRNNTQLTDGRISAPLWQQVVDWLWVRYHVVITRNPESVYDFNSWILKGSPDNYTLKQAIIKAIELCQKK